MPGLFFFAVGSEKVVLWFHTVKVSSNLQLSKEVWLSPFAPGQNVALVSPIYWHFTLKLTGLQVVWSQERSQAVWVEILLSDSILHQGHFQCFLILQSTKTFTFKVINMEYYIYSKININIHDGNKYHMGISMWKANNFETEIVWHIDN